MAWTPPAGLQLYATFPFLTTQTRRRHNREAIEAAVRWLKKEFPVDKAVVFDSKARVDFDEHSDIDLLIITSRTLHSKEEKAIVEELFHMGLEYDVIFSPLFAALDSARSRFSKEGRANFYPGDGRVHLPRY
jgi:predicted nucleotidyltransferase